MNMVSRTYDRVSLCILTYMQIVTDCICMHEGVCHYSAVYTRMYTISCTVHHYSKYVHKSIILEKINVCKSK